MENITLTAKGKEYRPALVFDDVHHATISSMSYLDPTKKKKQVHLYKSTDILQKK
jgi:hypothetical protein